MTTNPYHPGAGLFPACLAGRTREQEILDAALARIVAGQAAECHILYGPRGNGKTVLLSDLRRKAANARVALLDLILGEDGFLEAMPARPRSRFRMSLSRIPLIFRAGMRGNFLTGGMDVGASLEAGGQSERGAEYFRFRPSADALWACMGRRGDDPLLVTLDEAHEVPPKTLGALLRAAQQLRADRRPMLLVMAGTPGLRLQLSHTHASFWSRAEHLSIGLLSRQASAAALREPAAALGTSYSDEALELLVEASDRYPYFVQLLGREAWTQTERKRTRTVTHALAERARHAAAPQRDRYYGYRYAELRDEGLLQPATAVARVFQERPILSDAELEEAIMEVLPRSERGQARKIEERLHRTGLVWEDPPGTWRMGIPTLGGYVLDRYRPPPIPSRLEEPAPVFYEPW